VNYQHLLYFWSVARSGSLVEASRRLRLAPQTLSAQIKSLEDWFECPLFERRGGRLELTEPGRVALAYADRIFSLGAELRETVKGGDLPSRVRVGVEDTLAKSAVQLLLEPVLSAPRLTRVVCSDGSKRELAARIAAHELDIALTDGPLGLGSTSRVSCRVISECAVAVYAAPDLAARLRDGFPQSLDGAPLLLPLESASLRQGLDRWFAAMGVRPVVMAELADSALVEALGCKGAGAFAAPVVVEEEVTRRYAVERVGCVEGVRDRIFATVPEGKEKVSPAVALILDGAQSRVGRALEPDAA